MTTCEHGRPDGQICPHCLGVNTIKMVANEMAENDLIKMVANEIAGNGLWPPHGHLVIEQQLGSAVTLKFDVTTGCTSFLAWDLVDRAWVNDSERCVEITREAWWDLIAKLRAGVPREIFEALRGRYGALVHDRDRLQARVTELEAERKRWSTIYKFEFLCELRQRAGAIDACQQSLVIYAPDQTIAIRAARGCGWHLDGDKHHCALCAARISP